MSGTPGEGAAGAAAVSAGPARLWERAAMAAVLAGAGLIAIAVVAAVA